MANNNERTVQESENNDRPTTPRTPTSSTTPKLVLQKQTSQKGNCLCSPTTHSGSFRCRYHRNSFHRNGASIGSGLSDLATTGSVGSDLSDLAKTPSPSSPSPTTTFTKA